VEHLDYDGAAIMLQQGLMLSFVAVALWALNAVVKRFIAVHYTVEPIIFTCVSLLAAALMLILIAGPGRLGVVTLKKPQTWAYGFFEILVGIAHLSLLMLVSSTEASFLTRLSVFFSLMAAWLFFERQPKSGDTIGSLIIVLGIACIIAQMRPDLIIPVVLVTVFCELAVTARTLCAETHPTSNQAESIKERCRVTGYVLMVCSFFFIALTLLLAWAKSATVTTDATFVAVFGLVPNLADFKHAPTLLFGILYGAGLLAVTRYYYFYAARVAKSENLLAMGVLAPFITFGFEWGASRFGLLDISTVNLQVFAWGLLSLAGAVLMLWLRYQRDKRRQLKYTG
jgi:hypothetical protein